LVARTNALGNTTTYSYNSFNEQTCAAEPLAANPCSSLSPPSAITAGTATITPPSSAPPKYATYREFDTDGNLIYTTTGDYAPGSGTASQLRTTYDLYNGQSVTLNSVNDACTNTAPSTELPCATINADGVVTQLAYDSHGDLTSKSTPDQNIISSAGTINTYAGGPMGSVTANNLFQKDQEVSTATIGGTSYAYVADAANSVIRRVNLSTDAETVIAGDYVWGFSGDGGAATGAQLANPEGVAVDSAGDFAIADTNNDVIRFVPATSGTYFGHSMTAGDIYTIAGNGTSGYSGNNGAATSAELSGVGSVTLNANGLAIADTGNNVVRFVPLASGTYFGVSMTAGDIYLVAGNHTAGYSGNGRAATSAELNSPNSVAFDGSGDLAIADTNNHVIRFIASTTTTHFGQSMTANHTYTDAGNHTAGYSGFGLLATTAKLYSPQGVAFDGAGDLIIADTANNVARFVPVTSGTYFAGTMYANDIYTVAGYNSYGYSGNGGPATSAQMGYPLGVAMDASGDLLISDNAAYDVRVVAASSGTLAGQSVTIDDIYGLAGTGSFSEATNSGAPANEELNDPSSVRTDAVGDVVIADTYDNAVRFIPATSGTYFGVAMTAHTIYPVAGDGVQYYGGNGGLGTSAYLNLPGGAAIDGSGDVALADTQNNVIRFVPKTSGTYFGVSMTAGDIYNVAGNTTSGYSGNGGAATSAELKTPGNVAFDSSGDLVITDSGNSVIRFVPKTSGTYYGQSMTANDIYTIAGNATAGYSGNGAAATSAKLSSPNDATVDSAGDLLVADAENNAVRFVPAASGTYYGQSMTANDIYTIAGNGTYGNSGVGGVATSAELGTVTDAAFDVSGDVFIADAGNDLVQFVPRTTAEFYGASMTANDLYTIAGQGWGSSHFSGDGGAPLGAQFAWITSVAPDPSGGYYISDSGEGRIRYVAVNDVSTFNVTTTYTYNTNGEVTGVTTPNGNLTGANAANFTTAFTLNADGEVTVATQGGGVGATVTARTTDYGYDGDGNQTSVTDARGYATDYAFNADDEETLVTNPLSNVTLVCYDGDGNVAETVPAVGVAANTLTASSCPTSYPTDYGDRLATDATTYAYNALGEKMTVTTPAPAGLSGSETTTYAYDLAGRLTSVTAPPTSTSGGAANDVTAYTYDDAGEPLTTTTGYGTATAATTSSCFDPNGSVTATVAADGNTSSVATCSGSSPYETSSPYQTGYSYDSLGELVTQTAPVTTAAPSGQVTTYSYDPAGNELTEENPDGVTATNTYTPLNQFASVTYSDGTHDATYTYDADGNQTGMFDASGITSSSFDPFDELTSTTNGRNKTTTYGYDLDGDVTGITYPLGSGATWAGTDTVAYTYDHADQLASVTDFNGHTSNLTVSADGLPTAFTLGASGDTVSTTYGANDAPSSITLGNGSTLQAFAYSDAPSGGILSETDTPSSALSPANYVYDAQSRVTSDTPGTGGAKTYVEDASGNLTTTPTGASGTYDYASELTSSVLSGTTTSYTYDASGNRLGASVSGTATVSATYNGASELTNYDNAAANMTTATYDGEGLRTADTTGSSTQHFIWNEVTSVPELLMDSTNAYIYGPSGAPFEQVTLSGGTIHYLDSDALGSVRGVVSSGGTLTASTSYDAWGNPETTGGLTAYTPVGFAGGYTDGSNLIYLINRYYDPTTGTFVSVDPMVEETGQPYRYTEDDPVNVTDVLGLWPSWSDLNPIHDAESGYHEVTRHWRGIVQTIAVTAGSLAAAGCIAASAGLCSTVVGTVLTVGALGGVTSDAVYGVSTNIPSLSGYAYSFGTGVVGGFAAAGCGLSVGIVCGTALGASTFNGVVGGALNAATYYSVDCFQNFGGYVNAFNAGFLQSQPVPIPVSWLP